VKAMETCTNRQAFKIGKPSPYVCEAIINRHKVDPSRTLMIGDRQVCIYFVTKAVDIKFV
jgi:ribonucleotide monophosphatase NagD (HAD superfamily)